MIFVARDLWVLGIEVLFAVVLIGATRIRMRQAIAHELVTLWARIEALEGEAGQMEYELDAVRDDLAFAESALADGDIEEAHDALRKLLDLVNGIDEAERTDLRWEQRHGVAA